MPKKETDVIINSDPKDLKSADEAGYMDLEEFGAYVLENTSSTAQLQFITELVSNPVIVNPGNLDEHTRLLNEKGIGKKPMLLLINEFIPLTTSATSNLTDADMIDINFNQQDMSVTSIVKLIELQNILNKQINKIGSDYLIKNATKVNLSLNQEEIGLLKVRLENFYNNVKRKLSDEFASFIAMNSRIDVIDKLKEDLITDGDTTLAFLDSLDTDFLFLLCNLGLNDIFVKKIMKVIRNINLIKEQHYLTFDFLKFLSQESIPSQNEFSKYFDGFRDEIRNMSSKEFFLNTKSESIDTVNDRKNNLAKYLNLCSKLLSDAALFDTVSSIEADNKTLSYSSVKFSSFNNLKYALDTLKSVTFASCIHPAYLSEEDASLGTLAGSDIQNILNRTGESNNTAAIAELLAAICFDHVSGANNIIDPTSTLINPTDPGILAAHNNIIEYINTELMTGNNTNFAASNQLVSAVADQLKQSESTTNSKLIYKLFSKREKNIAGTDTKSIPFEDKDAILLNYYPDDLTDESFKSFVLNELVINKDSDLNEFKTFLSQHKDALKRIIKSFINTFSLGFNSKGENKSNVVVTQSSEENNKTGQQKNTGAKSSEISKADIDTEKLFNFSQNITTEQTINTEKNQYVLGNLNPMSFLNYYLQTFAEDLEHFVNQSEESGVFSTLRQKIFSQYFYYNGTASSSLETMKSSFLGSFLGNLLDQYSDYLHGDSGPLSDTNSVLNMSKILLQEVRRNVADVVESGINKNNMTKYKIPADTLNLSGYGYTNGLSFAQENSGTGEPNLYAKELPEGTVYGQYPFTPDELLTTTNWQKMSDRDGQKEGDITVKFKDFYSNIFKYLNQVQNDYNESDKSSLSKLTQDLISENNSFDANNPKESVKDVLQNTRSAGTLLTRNGTLGKALLFNTALHDHETKDNQNLSFPNVSNLTNDQVSMLIKGNYVERVDDVDNKLVIKTALATPVGNIAGTSNLHLYLIYHIFCLNLYNQSTYMRFGVKDRQVPYTTFSTDRIEGMIDALKSKEPTSSTSGYMIGYNNSKQIIDQVKNKIIARNNTLLKSLYAFQHQIEKIDSYIKELAYFKRIDPNLLKDMQSFLNINTLDIPFTQSAMKYALCDYNYSFNINKDYFPLPDSNLLSTKETDLKIMYKIFLSPNQGFFQEDNINNKKIFHVGISDLLVEQCYKNAGERSNLICLIVERTNQIDLYEITSPKYFIFDMSKYILPSYMPEEQNESKLSNQILNYADTSNYDQLMSSIEYLEETKTGIKSLGTGHESLESNGILGPVMNNYTSTKKLEMTRALHRNHVLDYYLKLYTKTTTESDMIECNFPLIESMHLENSIDDNNSAKNFYQKVTKQIQENTLLNVENFDVPEARAQLKKSNKIIKTSPLFNSQARAENNVYNAGCFNRVFSFLLDEKDFVIQNDINADAPENENISFDGSNNNSQSLNADTQVAVYNFTVKVGLLKRW
jgi:hypothetical protein